MRILGVVHGGSTQQNEKLPARVQYKSGYYGLKAEYAEKCCDDWVIISEKHGIISPEKEIKPYNTHIDDLSGLNLQNWRKEVQTGIDQTLFDKDGSLQFDKMVFLASGNFIKKIEPVIKQTKSYNVEVESPLPDQGRIGYQQQWLRNQIDRTRRA
ncbi:hypothetical protein SAMN05421858_4323 [Haladaptatus litoreus]|uniref:DUF6884 domain-containing protein n=1 Tax=Haladaptatus litoreus TaxID=553468 RepID=A0A1N7EKG3_9EURY|nr:DUF6884 domain-containing protein [Haladaptatus litoreus]SIR88435.1 hypothetical protein SAMN05421858_4323 [Haladaptatus litoreus]